MAEPENLQESFAGFGKVLIFASAFASGMSRQGVRGVAQSG